MTEAKKPGSITPPTTGLTTASTTASTTTRGRIELIIGPMFAGKTTELIRRIKRFKVANQRTIHINYMHDTRYDSSATITTHDRIQLKTDQTCTRLCSDFPNPAATFVGYDVIAIDEGQFYPDIDIFAEKVANLGKVCLIASLDGDFRRQPYPQIMNLIPKAEQLTKLNAVCQVCYEDAPFTSRRIVESETSSAPPTKIDIGGSEKYQALCRTCWNRNVTLYPIPVA